MLNPLLVEDVIDDVLGNKKDPYRLAKDFLNQIDEAGKRVKRLEAKLANAIEDANSNGGLQVASVDTIDEIEELERLVERARIDYKSAVSDVKDVIKQIEDEKQRELLTYRYVDLLTNWKEIAEQMDMSRAALRRLHTTALNSVKNINEGDRRERIEEDALILGYADDLSSFRMMTHD